MGLSSTLYTGISGLKSNSEAMSVTGNNISNSNTVGFKSSSTLFSDVLSASISSASGGSQVGRGVQISNVSTVFSQGSFQSSSSSTDLAIEGEGFFMLGSSDSEETLYTRNGSFSFDSDGYLVNDAGYQVLGKAYETNADGTPIYDANGDQVLTGSDPTSIQIDFDSQIAANSTDNMTLTTNLDAGEEIIDPLTTPFDTSTAETAEDTSNYSTSTLIYDSLGDTHQVTTYFTKTADQTWSWNMVVASDELDSTASATDELTVIGSGTLAFDSSGNLDTANSTGSVPGTTTAGVLDWLNGSDSSQQIELNFDTTQFSSSSVVISQSQDGYAPGEVVDVSIDDSGSVIASYSNGENINVAMLTLATFNNPSGLSKEGGSLYSATSSSGDVSVGTAGASQGYIYTNSLELSNVDLATEFVNMITIQNGYSASSKIITTTDEMLQEVINLKR
jgi:flagellar hook protein FlgE